ncbi:hypothetical protein TNCV_2995331 [Trichonephila clavipes]|nr:hypothetical protein TNCV_2995331 [Trichonephila clavipes]
MSGFLGSKTTPKALAENEIQNIFNNLEAEAKEAKNSKEYVSVPSWKTKSVRGTGKWHKELNTTPQTLGYTEAKDPT